MLPNFLFLGPDKAGSSWLFELLRHHPQCFVPACKDVYFFDKNFEKGEQWYESFFDECPEDVLRIGELSHDYLFHAEAAERIRRILPGARLITILRHPVERTWSQYLYMKRNGYPAESLRDALGKYPFLLSNSQYAFHLEHYRENLSDDSLRIFWFDELVKSPAQFASEIFAFLDVDEAPDCVPAREVREAAVARSRWLAWMAKKSALLARNVGAVNLVGTVKHSFLTRFLYRPYRPDEKPLMQAGERRYLLDYFAPGIEQLERLTGKDLSDWRL